MAVTPGQLLDRYTIEILLGEGGMGRVYRAFDQRLQRHVALKILRLPVEDEPAAAIAGALREARAAAAITHPNVTAVFDAGELAGTAFIVQELVRGVTVRTLLGAELPPLSTRLRWLMEIAAGLGAGHRAGVVHRDVKPENVIVRDDGRVKVLDFGIARRTRQSGASNTHTTVEHSTQTFAGLPRGTPAYMSPEQIRDDFIDGRSDQFSWGVVAHELLTRQLPWRRAKDILGYVGAVLTEEVAPPSRLVPELPTSLDALVQRALAKNADERFSGMAEIVEILGQLLESSAESIDLLGAPGRAELASAPTPLVVRTTPSAPAPSPRAPLTPTLRTSSSLSAPTPSHTPQTVLAPAPTSPRWTPARLRAPRFDAPVDLDAHLQHTPAGTTCKGLFFHDLLRTGARAGLTHAELCQAAGIPDRRYQRFHDYPLSDFLRLLMATARHAHARVPMGEGLRLIGRGAFDVVMESQIGRALLSVLSRDLDGLLKRGPRVYKQMLSEGEMVTEQVSFRAYVFHIKKLPLFLETYQVGALEGVLAHCGATGQILIQLDDLGTGRIELELR